MSLMIESGIKTRSILGLQVAVTNKREVLDTITRRFRASCKTLVVFANTNLLSLIKQAGLSDELSSKCFVLNDGIGLDILSLVKYKTVFPENLNGTDFTLDVLKELGSGPRVYCFGASENVIKKAVRELSRLHPIHIVGSTHGFLPSSERNAELIDVINAAHSDVVLVGLGNTLQEEWMLANSDRLTAKIIICVGAFFDFTAGAVYRAPLWARRLRVEWVFRFVQEPSRLWRRYSIDPLILLLSVFWKR